MLRRDAFAAGAHADAAGHRPGSAEEKADAREPGGDRDPATVRPGRRRFRWLTLGMLVAFAIGLVGLGAFLVILAA